MQKVGIIGSASSGSRMIAALLRALAAARPEPSDPVYDRTGRKSHLRRSTHWYLRLAQVKTSWPGQTDAQRQHYLAVAEAKRARKAAKLGLDMSRSFGSNYAHWTMRERRSGNMPKRPDPFYVARS